MDLFCLYSSFLKSFGFFRLFLKLRTKIAPSRKSVYNLLYSSLTQAFAEEAERQKAEEKKRDEAQALRRWYQLLSSIVTRQRLNNRYNNNLTSEVTNDVRCINENVSSATVCDSNDKNQTPRQHQMEKCDTDLDSSLSIPVKDHHHEHVFLKEYESFDKETSLLTKRCQCGFSVQVEEL
jgi:xeroderma pigmentosum group C-complementing protein